MKMKTFKVFALAFIVALSCVNHAQAQWLRWRSSAYCPQCQQCAGGRCYQSTKQTTKQAQQTAQTTAKPTAQTAQKKREFAPGIDAVKKISRPVKTIRDAVGANNLGYINAARAALGLSPLAYSDACQRAAQYCANFNARNYQYYGGLVHLNNNEILAMNYYGLSQAVEQWSNSYEHAAIMRGGYRFAGVGIARDIYGRFYCCVVFAR